MKNPLVAVVGTVVVLVGAYLAFALFRPKLAPCESIFQQTSLKLGAKLDVIKARGPGVSIEEAKIQDLTERSQGIALNLKTCCIVLEGGKLSADEFLRCKQDVETFEARVEKVASTIDETRAAKQRGRPDVVSQNVELINQDIDAAREESERLTTHVSRLSGAQGRRVPTDASRRDDASRVPTVQPVATAVPVALPARREYTIGSPGVTFTLLKAEVSPHNDHEDALKLRVRMINNLPFPTNFWNASFRLVVDGLPLAPGGDLNELVDGRSGKDGDVSFFVPHGTSAATLKLYLGDQSTDVPLELGGARP